MLPVRGQSTKAPGITFDFKDSLVDLGGAMSLPRSFPIYIQIDYIEEESKALKKN